MNNSSPAKKRKFLILAAIVLLIGLIAAYVGFQSGWFNTATRTDATLSDISRNSMSIDANLSTESAALKEYKEQISKKSSIAKSPKGDQIVYYNYLIQSAQRAQLCDEAKAAAKELEAIDVVSAFSGYFAILRCYTNNDQAAKAEELREYMKSSIDRLPQEEQETYRMRVES